MPARPDLSIDPLIAARRFVDAVPHGTRILVALSGGGDSLGLLVALQDAARAANRDIVLRAATVDHRLRPESAHEAAAMARFCAEAGIEHRILVWDEPKPATGVSEAARAARYRLLCEAAEAFSADVIVTGHTQDDQLETVEMRRRRGEGRGLAGIAKTAVFVSRFRVARPFLDVERQAIRRFLEARRVAWFDDPSNDDPHYERVRTRKAADFPLGVEAIRAHGERRTALAADAARFVAGAVAMPLPLLFAVALDNSKIGEAERLAIAFLVAIAGGREHMPGQQSLRRVWDGLEGDPTDFRLSLSRTVVERRKGVLFIGRDVRDLPEPVRIGPHTSIVWDGRFRIENRGTDGVVITAGRRGGEADGKGDGVPARVANRAIAALPAAVSEDAKTEQNIVLLPVLAPFEAVMPGFECELVCKLTSLTGRPAFPSPIPYDPEAQDAYKGVDDSGCPAGRQSARGACGDRE